ncbi:Methyltransf-25 domain-containing protein [Mycena chlorophos]|uniref:Methyltransf-25 domain-containing protein n=1 Tax=Mycena chlorophos TaxID=658473 RepID=A0A8H6SAD7_MYCCL|nr:Methyltransf-25 domain-containing protein [Mycena chlorophos]
MASHPETPTTLPVVEAYTRWAKTYDADENFLQRVDNELVAEVLPQLLSTSTKTVVDLGCGTGRNTAKLLGIPGVDQVLGLDVTEGMLDVARTRPELVEGMRQVRLVLGVWDVMGSAPLPFGNEQPNADALISTLVLEHLPCLDTFFLRVRQLLRPGAGAWVLLTNMHPVLGRKGGANFIDETNGGTRTWTAKYVWGTEDVLAAAARAGFAAMQGVGDDGHGVWVRTVRDEEHASRLGAGSVKWIGKEVLFGVALLRMG